VLKAAIFLVVSPMEICTDDHWWLAGPLNCNPNAVAIAAARLVVVCMAELLFGGVPKR
jgi:hypothetical protein